METKICTKCGIEKNIGGFHNSNKGKFGKVSNCKICVSNYQNERKELKKEYDKNYRIVNKIKIDKRTSEYNQKNKELISLRKLNWYRKNKNRINKKLSDRKKLDPIFKLKTLYRSKINKILGSNREKTFDLIGCTPIELKLHIEGQFKENMCWENHGPMGWHIDHIMPLSSAKNEDELKKLCHYTNLQPLWWFENLEKRDKVLILPNNADQPI
jgi:hypothetical protein